MIIRIVIMDEFIVRALIAGILVASVAGLLGVFIVWRRMAFFGDTLSHSALLGVALGMLFNVGFTIGVLVSTLLVGLILYSFQKQ
jgi:zinc transport system permease protein